MNVEQIDLRRDGTGPWYGGIPPQSEDTKEEFLW